jgi:Tfp pilus assembly protein PilN
MKAVNLIPTEQRGGGTVGSRSEGAVFAVLGLLAGVVVLTLLYGFAHHELSNRRAEAAALAARAQQAQAQAAELASYTSFVALREQRLQAISTLIGSRFDWSAAMGELSRVLPGNVSLSSLQGTIGAGSATVSATSDAPAAGSAATASAATASAASVSSATPPGATPTFTLTGCAASQDVVAQTLVRLHLISGVDNVTLQSSAKSGSAGASGGGGSCPGGDPTFSAQIAFQPLPTPPSSSVQALESTTPASSTGDTRQASGGRTLSSARAGGDR